MPPIEHGAQCFQRPKALFRLGLIAAHLDALNQLDGFLCRVSRPRRLRRRRFCRRRLAIAVAVHSPSAAGARVVCGWNSANHAGPRLRATYLSIKLTSETTLPTCCDLRRCCTHKRGGHKPRSWCCTWLGVGVGVGVGVGETHCKHGLAHLVRGKGRGRGGGRGRVKVKRTSQRRQTAPRA